MGRLGFEPRTNRLKAEYSTVELATPKSTVFSCFFPRIIIITQDFLKNLRLKNLELFFWLGLLFAKR